MPHVFREQPLDSDAFELVDLLGSGSFGRVYSVREKQEANTSEAVLRSLRPRVIAPLENWITVGAPGLKRTVGKWYYEVILGRDFLFPQIGWVSDQFESGSLDEDGVGDDEHGWAADGVRHKKWHMGDQGQATWPSDWKVGDVIGVAIHVESGDMLFSLNGEWVPAASFKFSGRSRSFHPAMSSTGNFTFCFSRDTLKYQPPELDYDVLLEGPSDIYERPRPSGKQLVAKVSDLWDRTELHAEAKVYRTMQGTAGFPKYIGIFRTPDSVVMIIERIDRSLDDLRQAGHDQILGRLSIPSVCEMGLQALSLLQAMHVQGWVHRDVKPCNLMVKGSDCRQCYLIDFGLAAIMPDPNQRPPRQKANFAGSLFYAAARAHLNHHKSRSCDLESLAYSLLDLAIDSLPWGGASDAKYVDMKRDLPRLKEFVKRELARVGQATDSSPYVGARVCTVSGAPYLEGTVEQIHRDGSRVVWRPDGQGLQTQDADDGLFELEHCELPNRSAWFPEAIVQFIEYCQNLDYHETPDYEKLALLLTAPDSRPGLQKTLSVASAPSNDYASPMPLLVRALSTRDSTDIMLDWEGEGGGLSDRVKTNLVSKPIKPRQNLANQAMKDTVASEDMMVDTENKLAEEDTPIVPASDGEGDAGDMQQHRQTLEKAALQLRNLLHSEQHMSRVCTETFLNFDRDGNGCLDLDEVMELVVSVCAKSGVPAPSLPKVRALLIRADKSKDGVLSSHEFVVFFKDLLSALATKISSLLVDQCDEQLPLVSDRPKESQPAASGYFPSSETCSKPSETKGKVTRW